MLQCILTKAVCSAVCLASYNVYKTLDAKSEFRFGQQLEAINFTTMGYRTLTALEFTISQVASTGAVSLSLGQSRGPFITHKTGQVLKWHTIVTS